MSAPSYVLDSNVFIESKKKHYAFDIAPSFWKALIDNAQKGHIESIDRVYKEILDGQDELAEWVKKDWPYFAISGIPSVMNHYGVLMQWSQNHAQFTTEAKIEFARADAADAWLIAYAMNSGATIVTHEDLNLARKSKILIPVACQHHGVKFCDTFEMLRKLSIKL